MIDLGGQFMNKGWADAAEVNSNARMTIWGIAVAAALLACTFWPLTVLRRVTLLTEGIAKIAKQGRVLEPKDQTRSLLASYNSINKPLYIRLEAAEN